VQRPGANEGGREEEERGSGIATGETGRLHDRKKDAKTLDRADGQRPEAPRLRPRTLPPSAEDAPVNRKCMSCEFMSRL